MHGRSRPTGDPTGGGARRPLAAAALLALAAGLGYYALVRGPSPAWALDPSAGTFPSLVHGFATAALLLAATGLAPARRAALALGANALLTAALEATLGTFDPNDLVALGLGTLAAVALARTLDGRSPAIAAAPGRVRRSIAARPSDLAGLSRRGAVPLLLAASASMTMATAPAEDGRFVDSRAREPVYLDYAALRSAIRVTEPRALEDVGRVYLYEDTLFLNARNEGVHVIDNSDPANPRPVSFIEIPGATELEIRDGVMYADSYVDLVAIELGGLGAGPRELVDARQRDIFPWDPYQNVPADTRFSPFPDRELGVVIGIEGDDR